MHTVLQVAVKSGATCRRNGCATYFLTQAANRDEHQLSVDASSLNAGLKQLDREIPSTMVMAEMDKPRDTFVSAARRLPQPWRQGHAEYARRSAAAAEDAPRNRLTLAQWLVDPDNPLTARVAVNRFWQLYFGIGLVKTAEDFGSQGEPPSHPRIARLAGDRVRRTELGCESDAAADRHLGHLPAVVRASRRSCWRKIRRIACWRAVRASACPPRWFATTRWRSAACSIREIGGPSVFPYQPAGLWEEMAFGGGFSAQTYVQSHGERSVPPQHVYVLEAHRAAIRR